MVGTESNETNEHFYFFIQELGCITMTTWITSLIGGISVQTCMLLILSF